MKRFYLPFNKLKKKSLYNLAYIDPITELGNYYYFCKEAQEVLLKDNNIPKYILILDLEKFRAFNQYYGHDVGRKLIIELAKKITNLLVNYNNIISRFANDIFAIIIETNDNINIIADNLFNNLRHINVENETYNIYPIIGVYKAQNSENILIAIDKALTAHDEIIGDYNTKFNVYNENTEKEIIKEHKLEEIMEEALKNEEFKVYYQPKIELKTNKVVSCEALVRWFRNDTFIQPNDFIPLFEKNRFIIKLDKYVFKKACQDIKYINNLLRENNYFTNKSDIQYITASINVSKEHFSYDNFIDDYLSMTNKINIPLNMIELEITESASVFKGISLASITREMKQKGFNISLDDFGTGYSSLSMLQDLTIDVLKIDKSFIDKIGTSNIVKYIINMAKDFNIKTVAEGVETKEQVETLKNMGCDIAQGYYYSIPLSLEEFINFCNKT